jgi:hypothetical protein
MVMDVWLCLVIGVGIEYIEYVVELYAHGGGGGYNVRLF